MMTHVYAGMCIRAMREARSIKSGLELHVGSEQIELGGLSFEESDALVVICLALELHDGHFFDGDTRHGVFGVHHVFVTDRVDLGGGTSLAESTLEFLGARRRLGLVLEGLVVLVTVPEPRLVAWALFDMSFSSGFLAHLVDAGLIWTA